MIPSLRRVLLVEDNEDDFIIVRDLLSDIDSSVEIEWVSTYEAAYDAFMQRYYDVCLLDYHLGSASGLDLLRDFPSGSPFPIILFTGQENYQIDVAAAQAGAADYLVKGSITAPLLERSMRYAIQRNASETALLQAQHFAQATVDALPDHIAVLDSQGVIIAVNAAWRTFAEANGFVGSEAGVGSNYLAVCENSRIEDAYQVAAGIQAVMEGEQELFSTEYSCHSPTQKRWFEMRVTRFASNGPRYVVVAHTNVTARKTAEQRLRESEANLAVAQQIGHMGSWEWELTPNEDWTKNRIHWSEEAFRIFGYVPGEDEETFENFLKCVHPDDMSRIETALARSLQDWTAYSVEHRIVRGDGTECIVDEVADFVFDSSGKPVKMVGTVQDITARKRAEEASARLAAIVESSEDAIISKTLDGIVTSWNHGAQNLYGYTAEEMIGCPLSILVPSDTVDETPILLEKIRRGESVEHYETERVRKDGTRLNISLSISPLKDIAGNVIGASYIKRDITQRKRAEEKLREREEFQRVLLENFPNGSVNVFDRELRYILSVGAGLEQSGLAQQELTGKTLQEVFSPEQVAQAKPYYEQVLNGKAVEFELNFADRIYNINAAPLRYDDGVVAHFIAVAQDITQRRRAEAQCDRFFTVSLDMLGMADLNGYFKRVNPAFTEALGFTEAELCAKPFMEFVHPEDRASTQAAVEVLSQGNPVIGFLNRYSTKNGSWRWLEWKSVAVIEENLIYAAARDVTEHKASEAALHKMRDELEVRVQERTAELKHANAALQIQIVEREEAEEETRIRVRQQEAVAELGRRALAEVHMDTLLQDATSLVRETLDLEMSAVVELLPTGDTVRIRAAAGFYVDDNDLDIPRNSNSQAAYPTLPDTPIIVTDLESETGFLLPSFFLEQGVVSGIMVVVRGYERSFGTLEAYSARPCYFTQDDANFLQSMSNVLAAALERHRIETELRQLNVQLKETNEQLRIENIDRIMAMGALREIAAKIEQAKEEAEQARETAEIANQAKSEFLSRMSHELRTPLNAILGFGQILAMRNQDADAQQKDNIQQIVRAGNHLLALINEVLDIARIEAGHLSLSPEAVAVGPMLREVLDIVRPLAAPRHIEIINEVQEKCSRHHLVADQQRLKQVLLNLLSNSIKYNRTNGQVVISCKTIEGESRTCEGVMCIGQLRISVRDTGPGLTNDDIARLFVPFERLGAAHTQIEGTGIGLSLCKRLIEAMNGQVGVESEPGVGSTFWFELPLAKSAGQDSTLPAGTSSVSELFLMSSTQVFETARNILYIEDNLSNIKLIERIVSGLGEQIHLLPAMQGRLGLDLAAQHQPDLILLDVNLPDISGDEVLEHLKASSVTQDIPVVVLSADVTPRQMEKMLKAGAIHYLTKPLDVERFYRILRETLAE